MTREGVIFNRALAIYVESHFTQIVVSKLHCLIGLLLALVPRCIFSRYSIVDTGRTFFMILKDVCCYFIYHSYDLNGCVMDV